MIKWLEKFGKKHPKIWWWWSRYPAIFGATIGAGLQFLVSPDTDNFKWYMQIYTVFCITFETGMLYANKRIQTMQARIYVKVELLEALENSRENRI